jgi:hypothetical protein
VRVFLKTLFRSATMDAKKKKELRAMGKMALGGARIASGIATVTGKGILGGYFRRHGQMTQAGFIGRGSIQGGYKMFKQGLAEWRAERAEA